MFPNELITKAQKLVELCQAKEITLATAESCTGGLLAGLLTAVPGASAVVDRGFVTYANEAKAEMLGVPLNLIQTVGAVSSEVAGAMVTGALDHAPVDLAVSVTGIAGPGGGSETKPVGLVYIAVQRRGREAVVTRNLFGGDRNQIRMASLEKALTLLSGAID